MHKGISKKSKYTIISASTTISKAAEIMDQKSIGYVLVEEYGNTIGIVIERDIMCKTGWLIVVDKGEIVGKVTADGISRNMKYALVGHPLNSRDDYLIR